MHAVPWGRQDLAAPVFRKSATTTSMIEWGRGNEEGEPNAVMAANEVALTNAAGWEKGCCVAKRREGMCVCVCVRRGRMPGREFGARLRRQVFRRGRREVGLMTRNEATGSVSPPLSFFPYPQAKRWREEGGSDN